MENTPNEITSVLEYLGFKDPSKVDVVLVRRIIQDRVKRDTTMSQFTRFLIKEVGSKYSDEYAVNVMMADDMDYVNAFLKLHKIK